MNNKQINMAKINWIQKCVDDCDKCPFKNECHSEQKNWSCTDKLSKFFDENILEIKN